MRVLLDQKSYEEMLARELHPRDCYVRATEYLHHLYIDGVKYTVARAVYACLKEAQTRNDTDALLHLTMHVQDLERLIQEARARGENLANLRTLGDPPPTEDESRPQLRNSFTPKQPQTIEETGLNRTFLTEHFLRILYNKGRMTGSEMAEEMHLFYAILEQVIVDLRNIEQIDIIGQRGFGDINYEYVLTPRGMEAAQAALGKTQYSGPCPVTIDRWIEFGQGPDG